MNKEIMSANAPKAIGPYSQAILAKDTIYVSGQLPIDPATGNFSGDSIEEQTHQSLKNLKAVLNEAGFDMKDVVKATMYLSDINNFGKANEVYNKYFESPYPARAAFQVAALPKAALVEIECIAVK